MSASYERVGGTEVLGWLLLGSSLTMVVILIIFLIIIIIRVTWKAFAILVMFSLYNGIGPILTQYH